MFRCWGISAVDGLPGVTLNSLVFYVIRCRCWACCCSSARTSRGAGGPRSGAVPRPCRRAGVERGRVGLPRHDVAAPRPRPSSVDGGADRHGADRRRHRDHRVARGRRARHAAAHASRAGHLPARLPAHRPPTGRPRGARRRAGAVAGGHHPRRPGPRRPVVGLVARSSAAWGWDLAGAAGHQRRLVHDVPRRRGVAVNAVEQQVGHRLADAGDVLPDDGQRRVE